MAEKESKTIYSALAEVQNSVVVPKGRYNEYGGFYYRSYEDIVTALREPCKKAGIAYYTTDSIVQVGERYYVKAVVHAYLIDNPEESGSVSAYARETESRKGSDAAQVTGAASSYARKLALCGLFCIQSEGDPDAAGEAPAKKETQAPDSGPFVAHCRSCGTRYTFNDAKSYMDFVATCHCCPSPDWAIE